MSKHLKKIAAETVLLGFLCGECSGQGTLIARHLGANDPATEGFSLSRTPGASLAPVAGGPAGGAWSIGLSSLSEAALYSRVLTPQEQGLMSSVGWTLSLTLQVIPPYNSSIFGMFAEIFTGSQHFLIDFGATSTGDPRVGVNLSPAYPEVTLTGAGPGYHNYQLRFDAATQDASLWVDGAERIDRITDPYSLGQRSVTWGGGQRGSPIINANWSEVTLSIVPEPSGVSLLMCGGLLLFWCRARRRPGAAAPK